MKKQESQDIFAQFAKGKKNQIRSIDRKAVIYTRVSSYEQLNNTSLEIQQRECRTFCLRHGLEIVEEFGGTYESAKSDDERKEFKAMIQFLNRSRTVTDVVVYDLSRFSRTGGPAVATIDRLKEKGIDVHAVTQPADTDTAAGKMMQSMSLIYSHIDNQMRREKSVAGMIARLRKGFYCGTAPHGYLNTKVDGEKTIVPDPNCAKLIKLIFRLKAEQGLTNEEIRILRNPASIQMSTCGS